MQRRIIAISELKALLITSDIPLRQIRQIINNLVLNPSFKPFSLSLERNQLLEKVCKEDIKDRVPSYLYLYQIQYVECPNCKRLF